MTVGLWLLFRLGTGHDAQLMATIKKKKTSSECLYQLNHCIHLSVKVNVNHCILSEAWWWWWHSSLHHSVAVSTRAASLPFLRQLREATVKVGPAREKSTNLSLLKGNSRGCHTCSCLSGEELSGHRPEHLRTGSSWSHTCEKTQSSST